MKWNFVSVLVKYRLSQKQTQQISQSTEPNTEFPTYNLQSSNGQLKRKSLNDQQNKYIDNLRPVSIKLERH